MGDAARFPGAKGRVKADRKIAILFFGITRALRVTLPSLTEHLVAPAWALGAVELEALGPSLDFYPVAKMQARGDIWRDDFTSFRNLVHQLHSLRRVKMMAEGFQPDIEIFARPGMLYRDSLPGEPDFLARAHRKFVLVPDWSQWFGHQDRFAMAKGADEIAACGKQADRMGEYSAHSKRLHSERPLRTALDARRVRTVPLRASRVQAHGLRGLQDFSCCLGPMGKTQPVPPGKVRLEAATARSA